MSKKFLMPLPITLPVVCPAVTGVPQQWNCLPGHLVSFFETSCPSTTIQDLYATLYHSGETSMYLHSLYTAVLHRQGHNLIYPGTTPSVTITRKSSGHARNCLYMLKVQNSDMEILNILKLPWDAQGNGWCTTDSQVCKRMSDSDPRTGIFHKCL